MGVLEFLFWLSNETHSLYEDLILTLCDDDVMQNVVIE
jgi:hypothetical protein